MKKTKLSPAILLFATLTGLAFQTTLRAGDPPPVKVENAQVRAVPPVSGETAAFMMIVNDSDKPVRLVGATTPIAGMAMPVQVLFDGRPVVARGISWKSGSLLGLTPQGEPRKTTLQATTGKSMAV